MAASNSILKLQVDDKQYEASLKSAQSGMQALMDALRQSGKAFNDVDKQTEQYVRELGKMEAKATTARGRIGEMSSAFIELSHVEKQLTDQERQSPVGKALTESLEQLKRRTIDAKNELENLNNELNGTSSGGKGGFLSGIGDKTSGMLQVFGGNLLAEGVSRLTSELVGSVQESIELARQGEGIRIAFERLNQPGLLDELKAATHGTVSEIELMQQAIKFENFKLPVEDLANYLAFAQQKAKDTGESIDYLVNSIVTGLGRQSKQILDNLGISAAELTRRMNEGATMTQAVSDIIREEMAKAGDYVETAADRAARATADTKNKMEELGRSAMPVAEEFASAWAEIRNGAMSLVLPVLSTVADSIRDIREILGGEWDMPKLKPGIQNLAEGSNIDDNGNFIRKPSNGNWAGFNAKTGQYNDAITAIQDIVVTGNASAKRTGRSTRASSSSRQQTEMQQNQAEIAKLTQEYVRLGDSETEASRQRQAEIQKEIQLLEKRNGLLKLREEQAHGRLLGNTTDITNAKDLSKTGGVLYDNSLEFTGSLKLMLDEKAMAAVNKQIEQQTGGMKGGWQDAADAIQAVGSAMSQIEDPAAKVIGTVAQAIATVALGYAQATAQAASAGPWAWIAFAATGLATMISTIAAIHSATGYANGGIVKGNSYSGDNIFGGAAMVNAGELVLNRAQQGNLASALQGSGVQNMHLETSISMEQLRIGLTNNSMRRGKGEYVTSNRR